MVLVAKAPDVALGAFLYSSPIRTQPRRVMSNKRGQLVGTQRGNRQRFPYEPRVIGGKLMMPAELQAIHRYVVETPVSKGSLRKRAVVEAVWPELISKLPRRG